MEQCIPIFPSANNNINAIVSELKRGELSIKNRLRSIVQDADFVQQVADQLDLHLIANERCGSWYIQPENKAGSAYFKSTDGHFGQWSFSLRRLNLHLLGSIAQSHGCIIVDSTRRGKSMPDALSKTVPIWIAVINRLLFPELLSSHVLHTPPDIVSASEHSQIEARIDGFVKDIRGLALDTTKLKDTLQKPLRPSWIKPAFDIEFDEDSHFWPVVLCTASSRDSAEETTNTCYVQGAADDHESWAHGLTAVLFWQHRDELLASTEDDVLDVIDRSIQTAAQQINHRSCTIVKPTTQLYIASNDSALEAAADIVVYCSMVKNAELETRLKQCRKTCIHLVCSEGKIASRQLRIELNKLDGLTIDKASKVLCTCSTGRDLAVGLALAILCRYYTNDGEVSSMSSTVAVPNKASIKQKLSWIMMSMPDAAPSRATLQSVNAFLMS